MKRTYVSVLLLLGVTAGYLRLWPVTAEDRRNARVLRMHPDGSARDVDAVPAFDENGWARADPQHPSGAYPETTAVTEHNGRLYLHCVHARSPGVVDRRAAGF